VLPRQPLHIMPLAPFAWFTDDRENRETDIGQCLRAIAGLLESRVHENE
jgi:hypothetical protein